MDGDNLSAREFGMPVSFAEALDGLGCAVTSAATANLGDHVIE